MLSLVAGVSYPAQSQNYLLQTGTALHTANPTYDFAVADYDNDGKLDLCVVKKFGTGTEKTEVHILTF